MLFLINFLFQSLVFKGQSTMPLYVFQCSCCGKQQEIIQKYDDPFPECNNSECLSNQGITNSMIRLISNTTFILKGSCWNKDGYTKENNK